MIRPRRIATKMLLTMCIPLAAMSGIAGYVYVDADADRAVVDADATLAASAVGPDGLITLLQDERARTAIDLLGLADVIGEPETGLADIRESVDAARSTFATTGSLSGADDAFSPAVPALETLETIRSDADASLAAAGPGNVAASDDAFAGYSTVIDTLLDGTSVAVSEVDDADLHRHATTLDLAVRATEADSRIVRHLIVHTVLGDLASPGVLRDTAGLVAGRDTLLERLATGLSPELRDAHETMIAERSSFDDVVLRAVNTGQVDLVSLVAAASTTTADGPSGLAALRGAAVDELLAAVDDHADATRARQIVVAVALLGLAASIAAAIVGSRTVTRPLQRLVAHAEHLATDGLPAAVDRVLSAAPGAELPTDDLEELDLATRDEVGALASAIDRVKTAALEQAVEQALLRRNVGEAFVNLGRRNQALLDRQLEFITDLQRNENDPEVLHDLFRLDHLATRMRRNAESLLLLAGEAPARVWSDPIPIIDVVRSSLGEVEDYRRVEIASFDPAAITGTAVADIGHMLAELLENALAFSPPQNPVHVRGALVGETFRVSVVDAGIGMIEDEIAEANLRLSGAESFEIPPSRYLGHYVTGQLAQRHGIAVRLVTGAAGGITAEVDLPADMLWLPEAEAAPGAEPAAPEPAAAIAPAVTTAPIVSAPVVTRPAPAVSPPPAVPVAATAAPLPPAADLASIPAELHAPPPPPSAPGPDRVPLPKRVRGANLPLAAEPIARSGGPAPTQQPQQPRVQRVPQARPPALSAEAGSVFELFNGIRSGEAERETETSTPATSPGAPA